MSKSNDSTTVFKADITDFRKAMQEAARYVRLANSEFKEASAGLGKWANSADGLTAKTTQLTKVLAGQKRQLDILEEDYRRVVKEQGEGARGAEELAIRINDQKAAIKNTEQELSKYSRELEAITGESKDAADASNKFATTTDKAKQEIVEQEAALEALKKKYTDLQLEQKGNTQEAKDLAAEITRLSSTLNKSKNSMNQAEQAADSLGQEIKTTSDGFSVMKGVLANLVADGIRRAISAMKELATATFEAGSNFESSMSHVEAISQATADEMDALTAKAQEMGQTTKFTATEAGDAFGYMAMAGWNASEMLDGIEGIMNLAAVAGSDLATTSDIVTDALTAMGYEAKDAGRLADVMAAAAANSNTTVEKMGETFKYVGPIVGTMGYNMEDAAVAIGLMANAGIKSSQAGTALRSVITRLSAPPKACAKAMEELGISMTDTNGEVKPLAQLLDELRKKFAGLSKEQRNANAKAIAGQYAMSGFLAIMDASQESVDELTEAIYHSAGAAEEMADTMLNNVGGQLTLLKSNIESKMIKVFEEAAPTIKKSIKEISKSLDSVNWDDVGKSVGNLAEKISEFFTFVIRNGNTIKNIFVGLGSAMATIFVATRIGMVVNSVKGLIDTYKVLDSVTAALNTTSVGLNLTWLASPITWLVAGITAVGAAYVITAKNAREAAEAQYGLTEAEKELNDAIDDHYDKQKQVNEAREESVKATSGEFDYIRSLKEEYNSLIKSNGKVKKGYKDRANFILNELASALGLEIDQVKELIDENGKLSDSIDEVILKKQAEATLSAYDESYRQAKSNEKEALEEVIKAQNNYTDKQKEVAQLEEEWIQKNDEYNEALRLFGSQAALPFYNIAMQAKENLDIATEALDENKEALDKANEAYSNAQTTIKNYEGMSAAIISGDVKEITTQLEILTNGFKTSTTATQEELEEQVKYYEQLYDDILKAQKAGNPNITEEAVRGVKELVEKSTKELDTLKENMEKGGLAGGKALSDGIGSQSNVSDAEEASKIVTKPYEDQMQYFSQFMFDTGNESGTQFGEGIKSSESDIIAAAEELEGNLGIQLWKPFETKSFEHGENTGKNFGSGLQSNTSTDAVSQASNDLNSIVENNLGQSKKTQGENAGSTFGKGIASKSNDVFNAGQRLSQSAGKGTEAAEKLMQIGGSTAGSNFGTGVGSKENKNQAKSAGKSLAQEAKKGADTKDKTTNSETSGSNFAEGFWKGIGSWFKKVWDRGKELAQKALGGLKEGQKEGSPSKLTTQSGIYFGQGYENGINSTVKNVVKAGANLGISAYKSLKEAQQESSPSKLTYQSGLNFTRGYINGIVKEQNKLVTTVKGLVNSALKELLNLNNFNFSEVSNTASNIFSESMSNKIDYILDKMKYQSDQLADSFNDEIENLQALKEKEKDALENRRDNIIDSAESYRDNDVTNIQNALDEQVAKLEKQRDQKVDRIKKDYDEQVTNLKNRRDTEIASLEADRDKKIAKIQKKIDAATTSAEKKKYKEQITQIKGETSEEIKKTKERYKDQIDALKTESKNLISQIKENAKDEIATLKERANNIISATKDNAKAEIEALKESYKDRINESDAYYDGLINDQKEFQNAYQEASQKMIAEFSEALNNYQSQAQALIDNTISGITNEYQSQYDALIAKQNALISKLKSAGDLFEISGAGVMTVLDINEQTKQIKDYTDKLKLIKDKVSSDLFDQIASYDMEEGSAFIDRLLALSDKELKAYSDAFDEKMSLSESLSENIYQSDFDKVAKDYKDALKQAFKNLPEELEELGMQTMQGFIDGLLINTDYMESSVRSIVNGMVEHFRDLLGIHSPSKVMKELGEFTGEGFGDGLRKMVTYVKDAASQIADSVTQALDLHDSIDNAKTLMNPNYNGSIGTFAVGNVPSNNTQNLTFNQYNNSPKALDRLTIYRQTNSLLFSAKVGLANV